MRLSRRHCLPLLALLASGAALAQQPPAAPPTRLRGTIAGVADGTLTIATRDGTMVPLKLAASLQPTALRRLSYSDISAHDYIATVAAPDDHGRLLASYVMIFPEGQRGVGEGHYDWDLAPGTTMTNATVVSSVAATKGHTLSLVYKGTPIDIAVPDSALIITPIAATRADLRPGAKVFVTASKAADGSFTALRITVGKDGVDPPQ